MRGATPTRAARDRATAQAATRARRLRYELAIRAAVALVILTFHSLIPLATGIRTNPVISFAALVGLVANVPYFLLAQTGRWLRVQAYGRMLLDIVFITIGIWSAGGLAAAPYLGIYLVVPIYAGMVFSSTACVVATASATGCYLGIVVLERLGWLPAPPSEPLTDLWTVAAFNLLVLNVAGGLTALLARALRESRRRVRQTFHELENLMETIPDIIYLVDTSWTLVLWNRRLETMTGLPTERLDGRSVLELFVPEDRATVGDAIRRGLARGHFEVEGRLLTQDGRVVEHQWTGAPLRDEGGRVVGLTGVGRDITERKQAEAALRLHEQEVRQLQKMEAVGRLAGGIAHDFNNLLTVLMGRAQLIAGRLGPDHSLRQELALIDETAMRGGALTRQLLAFSRKQVLERKVLDLNALVANVTTLLRRFIGEDVELVIVPGARLARIQGDPAQIEQILMNLAVNARDAMPRGGRLTIETADVDVDEGRLSAGLRPGPYALLVVTDTGVGMDAETQSHAFEPFFTTKEPGKGTGLGLSTVYGIVKQHDGWITIVSAPGRGARFEIYLPRIVDVLATAEAMAVEDLPRGGWETVLVAEDETEVRHLACDVLRMHGYTVLEARHGREALEVAERHAEPIHLLVTDVIMPQMNGLEVAQLLGVLAPGLRVLYMSGYAGDGLLPAVVSDGGQAFLPKPFTPDTLARKVREVLDAGRERTASARARSRP